jgi:hypothetical protein
MGTLGARARQAQACAAAAARMRAPRRRPRCGEGGAGPSPAAGCGAAASAASRRGGAVGRWSVLGWGPSAAGRRTPFPEEVRRRIDGAKGRHRRAPRAARALGLAAQGARGAAARSHSDSKARERGRGDEALPGGLPHEAAAFGFGRPAADLGRRGAGAAAEPHAPACWPRRRGGGRCPGLERPQGRQVKWRRRRARGAPGKRGPLRRGQEPARWWARWGGAE